jgi:uncharacterized protein YjcR
MKLILIQIIHTQLKKITTELIRDIIQIIYILLEKITTMLTWNTIGCDFYEHLFNK